MNTVLGALLRCLVLFLVLNAPFWLLASQLFVNRALLNLEYVFPLMLAPFSPAAAAALLLLVWGIDWGVANAAIFHFHSPLEFLYSARFLGNLQWADYLSWPNLLLSLPFLIALIALWRCGPHLAPSRWRQVVLAAMLAVLLFALDVVNGSSGARLSATLATEQNIAGSPSRNLWLAWRNEGLGGALAPLPPQSTSLPQAELLPWLDSNPKRSVVYVLVESLGENRDERVRDWMRRELMAQTGPRYRLQDRPVPFAGSTTHGELRELCGLTGSYLKLNDTWAANCLPRLLMDKGYETHALHGFSKSMFMRSTWWPQIGFTHIHFAEDLGKPGEPKCGGTFAGLCDLQMVQRAFELAAQPRRFVYLLTLNSHLPLAETEISSAVQLLCREADVPHADCLLNEMLSRVLKAVGAAAAAQAGPAPLIVLAGDHAPPYGDRMLRDRYSPSHVPSYVLMPVD